MPKTNVRILYAMSWGTNHSSGGGEATTWSGAGNLVRECSILCVLGPQSIGMLSTRENYRLSGNVGIQERSGLEKKV